MSKFLTTEKFINKARLVHGNKYNYSLVKYKDPKSKIKILCKEHGMFEQIPYSHLKGHGCCKCGNILTSAKNNYNTNEFILKSKLTHNNIDYSLVEFINSRLKVKLICTINGHGWFEQTPDNHINKNKGCPKCAIELRANKKRKTNKEFIKKSNFKHDNKYNYSQVNYINNSTKVKIICPTHGIFIQTPNNHLFGQGCPSCNDSKGGLEIKKILNKNNIIFIKEYKFKDCKNKKPLPFDFYLPDYNICIEFNGRQHYEPVKIFGGVKQLVTQQKNDKIKVDYCNKNNIKLVVIKHSENIEEIMKEKLKFS